LFSTAEQNSSYFILPVVKNYNQKGRTIMDTKSANVLARVEAEVKEQAESIMSKLGLPASAVTAQEVRI